MRERKRERQTNSNFLQSPGTRIKPSISLITDWDIFINAIAASCLFSQNVQFQDLNMEPLHGPILYDQCAVNWNSRSPQPLNATTTRYMFAHNPICISKPDKVIDANLSCTEKKSFKDSLRRVEWTACACISLLEVLQFYPFCSVNSVVGNYWVSFMPLLSKTPLP